MGHFTDAVPSIRDDLRRINQHFGRSRWFHALGNGHTFHYPTLQDWQDELSNLSPEVYLYVGNVSGNSLFYGADVVANLATFRLVNADDWIKGFESLTDEVYEAAGLIGEFLQRTSVLYAEARLLSEEARETMPSFEMPELEDIHMPYFVGSTPS